MRTLKYVIIGLAVCSTLAFQSTDSKDVKKIILTSLDKKVNSQQLKQSADILEKRLDIFGISEIEIDIAGDPNQIIIQYYKDVDVQDVEQLLIPTGKLAFCSALEKRTIEPLITHQTVRDIFALGDPNDDGSSAIIGQANEKWRNKISPYLNKLEKSGTLPGNVKFAWSKKVDGKGLYSLYALQYGEKKQALIDSKNLSEASWLHEESLDQYSVNLAFNVQGRAELEKASRANLGKAIAIVIDQEVYAAPKVMSEISGGRLQITGDFNQLEVAQLAAILGGGELPVKFRVDGRY